MWWPSPLFGDEGRIRLEEARDLPDWYYVGLVLVVGGFWLAAYMFAIQRARLDRRVGIPAVAVAFNIAWELNDTFIVPHAGWQRPFNFAWFLLDIYIVTQVLKFGLKDYPALTPKEFKRFFGGAFLFAVLFIPAAELEINDYYGAYAGLGVNCVMSMAFISTLRRRKSSAGQSMYIAGCKGIGSALGVLMSVSLYPESLMIPVLGATVIILDTAYARMLYRQIKKEGQSPAAFNRPAVTEPDEKPVTV
ncbi:hypothetical protein OIE71_08595 [Streptomyces sp. NBC_01725]